MKFRKIIFFMFILLFIFCIKCDATTVDFDISKIAENFNNNIYVSKLSEIGETVSAKQSGSEITLTYGNDNIVFSFNNSKILSGTYPFSDKTIRKRCDILTAILIDTISTMQGHESGSLIAFALDDSFCYTTLSDQGIAKNYLTDENSNMVVDFEINPFWELPILKSDSEIKEDDFLLQSKALHSDSDCFLKKEDLIFYKTFSEDGNMDLYIGQSNELDDLSYDSVLTALNILFNDSRVNTYFKKNYNNISIGNFEFNGVKVDTNILDFPISNIDTVLLPSNMKYAKFTINRDIVKKELSNIKIDDSDEKNSSNSDNIVLTIVMVIIMLILLISLVIFVIKNIHSNK